MSDLTTSLAPISTTEAEPVALSLIWATGGLNTADTSVLGADGGGVASSAEGPGAGEGSGNWLGGICVPEAGGGGGVGLGAGRAPAGGATPGSGDGSGSSPNSGGRAPGTRTSSRVP